MARHTLYPTKMQYQEVSRSLVVKCPILKDRACNSSGYDTWRESLRNKFKKERSPLVDERTLKQKGLFGRKRAAGEARPPSAAKKVVRSSKEDAVEVDGEDDASLKRHIADLKLLATRRNLDAAAINDKMTRTLQHRIQFIRSHTAREILDKFPILKLEHQLIRELERAYSRLTVSTVLNTFLQKSQKIIDYCKPLKTSKQLLLDVNTMTAAWQREELKEAACCLLLPLAMGEKDVYVIDKDPTGPSPTLVYAGNTLQPGRSSLCMDGEVIATPGSVKDGFAAMFAAFYVYGVEYPRHAKNTMNFFQQHICKLDLRKPMPMRVQRFINSIV
ncbi:hypothetical protein GJAV_G00059790 [Gymnothorax javanicus]|nr:hypothetical protein GJAV_G00059790 [Gymnothorax javanicus]